MASLRTARAEVAGARVPVRSPRPARFRPPRPELNRQARDAVRAGLSILALAFVFLIVALFSGTADREPTAYGWTPLLALVAVLAVSGGVLAVYCRGIGLGERRRGADCRRGEEVGVVASFRNALPFPVFRLEANFFVSDLDGHVVSRARTTIALGPRETRDLPFHVRFDHIGTFAAGLEYVTVYDPLGVFHAFLPGAGQVMVGVSPRLVDVPELPFSTDSTLESEHVGRSVLADSMDYTGVRDYVPGDPLKTIHWKLSARSDHYLTREFERFTNPGVAVIMDFHAPGGSSEVRMGMFDAIVECGLSIGRYARERGMDWTLEYRSRSGVLRRLSEASRSDVSGLVADLPEMDVDPASAQVAVDLINRQLLARTGLDNVVVCTANLDDAMVSAIGDLVAARRMPLVVAVSPKGAAGADRRFSAAGLDRLDALGVASIELSDSRELESGIEVGSHVR